MMKDPDSAHIQLLEKTATIMIDYDLSSVSFKGVLSVDRIVRAVPEVTPPPAEPPDELIEMNRTQAERVFNELTKEEKERLMFRSA